MVTRDPYRAFKFEVEIDGFVRAGFSKITGLKSATEKVMYREGGDNETEQKNPGQTTFDDVVMERGQSNDEDFAKWRKEVFDVTKKEGKQGNNQFRRNVTIYLKDKSGARVKKWTLKEAWPCEDEPPEMDAMGNEIAIEKLTICHEGYDPKNLS